MSKSVYSECATVDKVLDSTLKGILARHLVIYNYSLSVLCDDPELTNKELSKKAKAYIEQENIAPVLMKPLMIELHYQHRRFKRNVKVQKKLTDLQYFTFLVTNGSTDTITISEDRKVITFTDFEGEMRLEKPLPTDVHPECYMNISYSSINNMFMVSIFAS